VMAQGTLFFMQSIRRKPCDGACGATSDDS
jgi:hypothetical protein